MTSIRDSVEAIKNNATNIYVYMITKQSTGYKPVDIVNDDDFLDLCVKFLGALGTFRALTNTMDTEITLATDGFDLQTLYKITKIANGLANAATAVMADQTVDRTTRVKASGMIGISMGVDATVNIIISLAISNTNTKNTATQQASISIHERQLKRYELLLVQYDKKIKSYEDTITKMQQENARLSKLIYVVSSKR